MYEWYEKERLWNIDMNRSFYEDYSIGELGIEYEIIIFENDLYRFVIEPLDSNEVLCYKLYRKDKEIYDICRISFFSNSYIETSSNNTFRLNNEELFLINQIIDSPTIMNKVIETLNNSVYSLVFDTNGSEVVRNNDYEKLSNLWNPIDVSQIHLYQL